MAKINENAVMKISDESSKTSLPENKDLYRVCEKLLENYELLDLKKAKEYYDSNLRFVKKVYGEKLKSGRVKLSEKLEDLKNELLKARKNI